jgi:hypothetical protein
MKEVARKLREIYFISGMSMTYAISVASGKVALVGHAQGFSLLPRWSTCLSRLGTYMRLDYQEFS